MFRILLVDDEENSLNMLENQLSIVHDILIVGKFTDPLLALSFVEKEQIDLAFLDIDMPVLDGLQLAEKLLQINEHIQIVFVTAYSIYAVKAFELYALDYLLKPVQHQRLTKTLERLSSKKLKSQSSNQLSIKCFGSFDVYLNENKMKTINWKTYKAKELFAYLAMHKDTAFDSDHLINILWPNDNEEKSKINLYTCISFLRKTFKNEGFNHVIHKSKRGYMFNHDCVFYDLDEFNQIVDSVREVTATTIPKIERMIKLYSGHFLEREGYLWAQNLQESIRRKFQRLLRETKEFYVKCGEFEKAILYLEPLIQFDPDNEQNYLDMMKLFVTTGKRVEAIKVFQEYRQYLNKEFSIEPSEEITYLYNQLIDDT